MSEPLPPDNLLSQSSFKEDDFLAKFELDTSRLAESLSSAKTKFKAFEDRVKILESEKQQTVTLLSQARKLNQELESKLTESQAWKQKSLEAAERIKQLADENKQSFSLNQDLELKLKKIDASKKEIEEENKQIQTRLGKALSSNHDLESKNQQNEAVRKETEIRFDLALKEKAEFGKKVSELQAWQEEAIQRAQAMLAKQKELTTALEETTALKQQSAQQLVKLQDRLTQFERSESAIELLKKENLVIKNALAAGEQAVLAEREKFQREKQLHYSAIADKDKNLNEVRSALEQSIREVASKKHDIEAMHALKLQHEGILQVMRNEFSLLQQTLSASNVATQKEFELEKARLAQNLADKEKGLSQVKSDLDLMREAMVRSQKMAEQAMSELNEQRTHSKLLKEELERNRKIFEEEKLATLKRQDLRQQDYVKLQTVVAALQVKLDADQEVVAKSEREQVAFQKKIQQMEEAQGELRLALKTKEQEVEAARREIVPIQGQLAQSQAELNQVCAEYAAHCHEFDFIFARMGNLTDRINPSSRETFTNALPQLPPPPPELPALSFPLNLPFKKGASNVRPFPTRLPQAAPVVSQVTLASPSGSVFGMSNVNLDQLAQADFPGDVPISISELVCACLDSKWREAWKSGMGPAAFRLVPVEAPMAAGGLFYDIKEEFIDWLVSGDALKQGANGWGEQELWKALHDSFLEVHLNSFISQGQFNEINFISRRLRTFCQTLVQLRKRTPQFQSWSSVYPPQFIEAPRAVFPMGDRRLVISGTIYGVRTHPEFGLELVDYKILPAAPEGSHLLLLALNALILGTLKPGISFGLGLEAFAPEFEYTPVSHSVVNTLLRETIVPVFYELVDRPLPAELKNPELKFINEPHKMASS